jgi:hypothetical protein
MSKKRIVEIHIKKRLSREEIEERIRDIEERQRRTNEAKERLSEYFGEDKKEEPTNQCDCNGCNNPAEFSWNGLGEKRKLCREHTAIAQAFIGFKKGMWSDLRNKIIELKKNPQDLFIEKNDVIRVKPKIQAGSIQVRQQ